MVGLRWAVYVGSAGTISNSISEHVNTCPYLVSGTISVGPDN